MDIIQLHQILLQTLKYLCTPQLMLHTASELHRLGTVTLRYYTTIKFTYGVQPSETMHFSYQKKENKPSSKRIIRDCACH